MSSGAAPTEVERVSRCTSTTHTTAHVGGTETA